jgi:hypothetical protein
MNGNRNLGQQIRNFGLSDCQEDEEAILGGSGSGG